MKFKSGPFQKLLLSLHSKPMNEQKFMLENVFNQWKGTTPQIDDVLVIGISI